MGIPTERIELRVEGHLDLRGTLGISKDVPVGFESIRLHFDIAAPKATPEQLGGLKEKNGTVLRSDANLDAAPETSNRLGHALTGRYPGPEIRMLTTRKQTVRIWADDPDEWNESLADCYFSCAKHSAQ